jgi:hypothetical protein
MLTKAKLFDALTQELENRGVDDAEEVADSVVETLDEEGAFNWDEDADE